MTNPTDLLVLLQRVADGDYSPEQALENLRFLPYKELQSGLSLDLHRQLRTGQGEVIFARGKDQEQLKQSMNELSQNNTPVLVTKLNPTDGNFLATLFPKAFYCPQAGLLALGKDLNLSAPWQQSGEILIVTAGSSDLPIALEALGTLQFYDLPAGFISDVGVAGLHRLTPHLKALQQAKLLIVVAGMEGALPSVISGFMGKPILAVPTSIGYGIHFHGLTPLLSMLNSCAPGMAVVNIDNGFGAALMAVKILDSFKSQV
jgi:hypothetical protein